MSEDRCGDRRCGVKEGLPEKRQFSPYEVGEEAIRLLEEYKRPVVVVYDGKNKNMPLIFPLNASYILNGRLSNESTNEAQAESTPSPLKEIIPSHDHDALLNLTSRLVHLVCDILPWICLIMRAQRGDNYSISFLKSEISHYGYSWWLLRYKADIVDIILRRLADCFTSKECPFCILHKEVCESCNYAKVHGICKEPYSSYHLLRCAFAFLRRVVSELYPKPSLDSPKSTLRIESAFRALLYVFKAFKHRRTSTRLKNTFLSFPKRLLSKIISLFRRSNHD